MAWDSSTDIVLVDLSSIAYPIYLTTQADPDPNKASQQIAARIRDLARAYPHAAICCDSGKSFRHDVAKDYKANRAEKDASLHHQITLACEALAEDGFPIWSVRGFEADDLIAAATFKALSLPDLTVLIVSADKDLLQLVGPRVRAKSARDGSLFDSAGVIAKYGVEPRQMRDYLTLVGDPADNIKGAFQIGAKKAAQILQTFDSLDACYAALAKGEAAIPAAIKTSLLDFKPRLDVVRTLVTLRTDVDLPFDEIVAERVAKDGGLFTPDAEAMNDNGENFECADYFADATKASAPRADVISASAGQPAVPTGADSGHSSVDAVTTAGSAPSVPPPDAAASVPKAGESGSSQALVVRASDALAPAEWERQLDPRSPRDARLLAEDMFRSKMFSAYGSAPAVLSTIMLGRELGLPAMASLRGVHVIEGRHALSASLMVALVLKSGMAQYFEPISFDATQATFETHRKGARNPVRLTHTFEMARQAWPKSKTDWEKAFTASGWGRVPVDMLVARATSRLARMVYPDLIAGLYTPDELAEIREQERAA